MLEIGGWALGGSSMDSALQAIIEKPMRMSRSGRALQIIIDVPVLQTQEPYDSQRSNALVGIKAMNQLFEWTTRNITTLNEIGTRCVP